MGGIAGRGEGEVFSSGLMILAGVELGLGAEPATKSLFFTGVAEHAGGPENGRQGSQAGVLGKTDRRAGRFLPL